MAVESPRKKFHGYKPAPLDWPGDAREWSRKIAEVANGALEGQINAVGNIRLAANSLTTVVRERRCAPGSVIVQMPTSENAGGEVGIYYSDIGALANEVPSFTINHGFDSRTDRTFRYIIIGQTTDVNPPDDVPNAPAPPSGDPSFANVLLLVMNGTGTEGNQDMADQSNNTWSITWLGSAQMDTGVVKFTSQPTLLLSGMSQGLSIVNTFNQFGTSDFTIEAWIRPTASGTLQVIVAKWDGSISQKGWRLNRTAGNKLYFEFTENGTTSVFTMASTTSIDQDVWTFVVMQRESNSFVQYINGVKDASPVSDSQSISLGGTAELRIGIRSTSADEFTGNMAPMRITLGEAVYAGNPSTITVPTTIFPTS